MSRTTQALTLAATTTDAESSFASTRHGSDHTRDIQAQWRAGVLERRMISWYLHERHLQAQLTASLTRTLTYSTVRFALYERLKEMSTTPTHSPSAVALAIMGASSGTVGSIAGNFADVVCLRMQHDAELPVDQRRNYKNIADGLIKMVRAEGIGSIWTGVWVGAARAALATATQLAGYDVIKRELMEKTSMTDTVPTHISASCLAGFMSTLICSPFDVFKARLMTAKQQTHSIPVMLARTFKNEGAAWMFHGLTPALISRAPSTIITFVTFEQLKRLYRVKHDLEE